MIHSSYSNFLRIYTDGSLNLLGSSSGARYNNKESGEKYYSPSNAQSSMDMELLVINAALIRCFILSMDKYRLLVIRKQP